MSKDNGGYVNGVAGSEHGYPIEGMNQRDYFASQALVGLIASGNWNFVESTVERAYKLADEMIKQRGN